MTGQDIIDQIENIMDDSQDPAFWLFYINTAKDNIETEREWVFNRGYDASQCTAAGDNYLSMKTLPTDYMLTRKLYLAGDITPLISIGFEERERYKDIYKRFYVDYINRQFAVCGAGNGVRVLNHFYTRNTPAITTTTSPVWLVGHHYLVFKTVEAFMSGRDGDEVNARMGPQNLRLAMEARKALIAWDGRIKTAEYNAKNERNVDLSSYPDIVGDNFIPQ